MITAPTLSTLGISHGFFTRENGHSKGIFASLNCGLGSTDLIENAIKNREYVAAKIGVKPDHLISPFQVHGTDVVHITGPVFERPRADALVTNTPGVALGILTADCGPILFADAKNRVVGACHAGWKGALGGVYKTTILAMENLGAERRNIVAVLGPTISKAAYEVGPEFPKPFISADKANEVFFIPSLNKDHHMFDLPGYLIKKLGEQNLHSATNLELCTYSDEQRFFSYRRTTHRGEPDYGRLISVIALA